MTNRIYSILVMDELERAAHACQTLLEAGAMIKQVFFYGQAVKVASLHDVTQDAMRQTWITLQHKNPLRFWVCQEAALRFGVLQDEDDDKLAPGFTKGSLGQFAQDCYASDQLLCFGVNEV